MGREPWSYLLSRDTPELDPIGSSVITRPIFYSPAEIAVKIIPATFAQSTNERKRDCEGTRHNET